MHPARPHIQFWWRNQIALDGDTEDHGSCDQQHHPRAEGACQYHPQMRSSRARLSVPGNILCQCRGDLLDVCMPLTFRGTIQPRPRRIRKRYSGHSHGYKKGYNSSAGLW